MFCSALFALFSTFAVKQSQSTQPRADQAQQLCASPSSLLTRSSNPQCLLLTGPLCPCHFPISSNHCQHCFALPSPPPPPRYTLALPSRSSFSQTSEHMKCRRASSPDVSLILHHGRHHPPFRPRIPRRGWFLDTPDVFFRPLRWSRCTKIVVHPSFIRRRSSSSSSSSLSSSLSLSSLSLSLRPRGVAKQTTPTQR